MRVVYLAFVMFLTAPWAASAQAVGAWGPWPSTDSTYVMAGFKHDDGGSLVVTCNQSKHLMVMMFIEPRATWRVGDSKQFLIRADTGNEERVSATVMDSHVALVHADATLALNVMGSALRATVTGDGDYGRVWPMKGFRSSAEVPMRACGDHW